MPQGLDNIINVQISQAAAAVTQVGFGVPLILGQHTRFSEYARVYTDTAGMLADGFISSDPEYIHAVELMSQALSVEKFVIGKRTAPVAQVSTISIVTVANNTVYTATINGTACTYTSDSSATGAEIQAGLIAAINGSSQASKVTASAGSGTDVVVTSDEAGLGFSITVTANLSVAETTPNHGVADDIANVQTVNDEWYGLVLTSKTAADIRQAASAIEAMFKIFMAASQDSDIPTGVTSDVLTYLKDKAYNRTALIYHTNAASGPDAAWVGEEFPKVPGSSTWKFKTLVGITKDKFTASQKNTIVGTPGSPGKNGNIYEQLAGINITEEGWMVSGRFIDSQIGADWTVANIQTAIYALLTGADKVPYTDQGVTMVENEIRKVLQQGVTNGLFVEGTIKVSAPAVADVSTQDKTNRVLPDITFEVQGSGAIHFVKIKGVITI